MQADSGAAYPSWHAAVAAVLAVALIVIAVSVAGRGAALVLGGLFAVAVAASRVYLADHYPLDVIGSVLCALAAAFIVTGLAALPALQPHLRRLDGPGGGIPSGTVTPAPVSRTVPPGRGRGDGPGTRDLVWRRGRG